MLYSTEENISVHWKAEPILNENAKFVLGDIIRRHMLQKEILKPDLL